MFQGFRGFTCLPEGLETKKKSDAPECEIQRATTQCNKRSKHVQLGIMHVGVVVGLCIGDHSLNVLGVEIATCGLSVSGLQSSELWVSWVRLGDYVKTMIAWQLWTRHSLNWKYKGQ